MYVCGPTVYGLLHVGNFRGPIFFNLVRNWLEKSGYKVRFALNYTDIDDKIINKAKTEGVAASDVAIKYITEFRNDFAFLELKPHDFNPKATDHIGSIIDLIRELEVGRKAYVAGGDVIYAIDEFSGYGKLSHRDPEDLRAGSRVEIDYNKRNPLDFVLWKATKPGEPSWNSPWGQGRPGWHIECSAMIRALFGDQIDIHGGGSDLIFPHHENEIAQSEGASHKPPFVKYWMHNNMLTFGAQKMSKSSGNIRTAREFMSEYNSEILKYIMLNVHYRSLLDFSKDAVERALSGLARIYSAMACAEKIRTAGALGSDFRGQDVKFETLLSDANNGVADALNDDFNTPEVFARIFEVVRGFNSLCRPTVKPSERELNISDLFLNWLRKTGQMMALFQKPAISFLRELDDMLLVQKGIRREDVNQLVMARSQHRAARDFQQADQLRKQLVEMGIAIYDSPQGTEWEVQK